MTASPPPTPRRSILLRGRHDLGEVVGLSYRLYGRNFAPMFAIALVTAPLQMLIGVIEQSTDSEGADTLARFLQIPEAFVYMIATGALVFAVHRVTDAAPAEFGASLDAVFERLWQLVRSLLLGGACAVAALIAFPFLAIYWLFRRDHTIDRRREWWMILLPGALTVFLAVRWAFAAQAVMIGKLDGWPALDESAAAVRGLWWRTLGILLVVSLIQASPAVVAAGFTVLMPPLPSATITGVVLAFALPFGVIGQTLLYYDLNARREANASHPDGVAAAGPDLPGEGP